MFPLKRLLQRACPWPLTAIKTVTAFVYLTTIPSPVPSKQKIVLHINDNPHDQYLVKRTIKSLHPSMVVRQVETEEKALEYLSQAILFNDLPCLIIMDLELTINGKEAYKEIRRNSVLQSIPIVVFLPEQDYPELRKWTRKMIVFISRPACQSRPRSRGRSSSSRRG